MAIPTKDTLLVAWGSNFDTKAQAAPATYSLSSAQATTFHTNYGTFVTAFNAVATAREAGSRSKLLTQNKDAAKLALLQIGRELYDIVQSAIAVSDANKLDIGVTPKNTSPSPIPPPSDAPELDVISVNAWTVKIRLHDATDSSRRGKPLGVAGASVFSFVGATPPTDLGSWKFEGSTGKTVTDIVLSNTVAPGARVWLTAFWFNNRKESGPACAPVGTIVQGGSVSMAA